MVSVETLRLGEGSRALAEAALDAGRAFRESRQDLRMWLEGVPDAFQEIATRIDQELVPSIAEVLDPARLARFQGAYQVAVVGKDNKVNIRTVKVGQRVGSMWIVTDGLKRGELVVAEGVQKVD